MTFGDNNMNDWYVLLLGLVLVIAGCSAITGSDEDDDDDTTTEYTLTVEVSPTEGGSVDPSGGTYGEGVEVTVEANANEGWSFTGWTGDIESSDNPLSFEITSDTELTANFVQQAKAYSNQIEVTDGTNSEMLAFGMDENATSSYDDGLDDEAPPAPPSGSFYGHFVIDGYNLFDDYRPVSLEQTIWEIRFGSSEANTITLNWDFNPDQYYGVLTLVDDPDNPSIEIDMDVQSSYEIDNTSLNNLFIIQQ